MVSGVFKFGFQTPPKGCLDQLDPILAQDAALFLHPINKLTCCGYSHLGLQLMIIFIVD